MARRTTTATATAANYAATKAGAEDGSMPANVSEIVRAIVTAGLAKLVDDVK